MRGGFSHEVIDEVKARTDIVELVSHYVNLKRTGKYYMGLCPFHMEKTPSFAVSPEKGVYHCFGCNEGGDAISFLMKKEGISFTEALKELADRAGVRLPEPEQGPAAERQKKERDLVLGALEWAARFYEAMLDDEAGGDAREYLRRRGVSDGLMKTFRLGYAPPGWDTLVRAVSSAAGKDVSPEGFVSAGLIIPRQHGSGYYDRFRDRIMFPICDSKGRVIGFGGRVLEGKSSEGASSEAKYVNSPESPVFVKGRNWYAFHLARESIKRKGRAVIVEGYMDAIACHAAGIDNAVASLGTALTTEQAHVLASMGCEIVVCFDSDAAGMAATMRSLEMLRGVCTAVRVAQVPEGKDPDEYVRTRGGEAFQKLIDGALPVVDYVFQRACSEADVGSPTGKGLVVEKVAPFIWGIDNEVERSAYVSRIAKELGVPEDAVWAVAKKRARASTTEAERHKKSRDLHTIDDKKSVENMGSDGLTPAVVQAEKRVAQMMLAAGASEAARLKDVVKPEFLSGSQYGRLARRILSVWEAGLPEDLSEETAPNYLLSRLDDEELMKTASSLLLEEEPVGDKPKMLSDCLRALKKRRLHVLSKLISHAGSVSSEERLALMREMQSLLHVKGSS